MKRCDPFGLFSVMQKHYRWCLADSDYAMAKLKQILNKKTYIPENFCHLPHFFSNESFGFIGGLFPAFQITIPILRKCFRFAPYFEPLDWKNGTKK